MTYQNYFTRPRNDDAKKTESMNTINDRTDKARESNLVDKSVREENKMQNGEDHKTKREKEIHIEIIEFSS